MVANNSQLHNYKFIKLHAKEEIKKIQFFFIFHLTQQMHKNYLMLNVYLISQARETTTAQTK